MNVGRKIYYDKTNGNILVDIGERQGLVNATTLQQDISAFKVLSERNQNTFDVIDLSYGEYRQDFAECSAYKVNVSTMKLEFSYPDPSEPEGPPLFAQPLTEQITELKDRVELSESAIDFLIMGGME